MKYPKEKDLIGNLFNASFSSVPPSDPEGESYIAQLIFKERQGGDFPVLKEVRIPGRDWEDGIKQDGRSVWVRSDTEEEMDRLLKFLVSEKGRELMKTVAVGEKGLPLIKSLHRIFSSRQYRRG